MNKVIIKRVIKIVIAIYLVVSTLATLNETGKGKEFWEAVDIGFFFGKLGRYEHNLIKVARDSGYSEEQIKNMKIVMELQKDPNFHMDANAYSSGYGNEIKYICKSSGSNSLKILIIKEFPSVGNITNMIILPIKNKKDAELKGKKRNKKMAQALLKEESLTWFELDHSSINLIWNTISFNHKFIINKISINKKEAKELTYSINEKTYNKLNYLRRAASYWRWHRMSGEKHRINETSFYTESLKVSKKIKKLENEIYYTCE